MKLSITPNGDEIIKNSWKISKRFTQKSVIFAYDFVDTIFVDITVTS